jgi:hypothetical protein
MSVARKKNEFLRILECAKAVSPEHPVVVSKFETDARELGIDAVADGGEIVLWAISEHVEDAGVHSGDATLVIPPPQSLYIATIRQARKMAQALAKALRITGPFNMQYLAKLNAVKVIECKLRASRSFPFVSKVRGNNYVIEAMRRIRGIAGESLHRPGLRGGQGTHVFLLAVGGRRPDVGGGERPPRARSVASATTCTKRSSTRRTWPSSPGTRTPRSARWRRSKSSLRAEEPALASDLQFPHCL